MNKIADIPNCKQCICYAVCVPIVKEFQSVGSLMERCEIMNIFIKNIKYNKGDINHDDYLLSINVARAMFKLRDLTIDEVV